MYGYLLEFLDTNNLLSSFPGFLLWNQPILKSHLPKWDGILKNDDIRSMSFDNTFGGYQEQSITTAAFIYLFNKVKVN